MTDNQTQAGARILWLEDDVNDREIVSRRLKAEALACRFTFAAGRDDFTAALQQQGFDLVLADYTLPGYDGTEALAAVQRLQPGVPLIYLSGHVDEDRIVQSLKAGAVDYVSKSRLQRLAPAIQRALREAADRRARCEAEEDLQRMRRLQEVLLNNIPFGIDIVDTQGQILYMNRVLEHLAPHGAGRYCWQVYADSHERCADCVMRHAPDVGQIGVRERPFMLGGKVYQINYVGVDYEGKRAALRLFQDISERKHAEEVQARLAAIVTSANDGIISRTLDGRITSWNRGAERIYGYSEREMLGQPIRIAVPPERAGELERMQEQLAAGVRISGLETQRIRKDGRRVEVSLTMSPIQDAAGRVIGTSTIVRDITEHKQLESLLRQAQKMEAIGQLAGGVAHDFNNLLTVIRGNSDLVLMGEESLTERQKKHLKQVTAAVERAANLTRQLLTFSRKQTLKLAPLDLVELLVNLMKMLKRVIGENVHLQCEHAAARSYVEGDPGMIEQVLLNLVVNARDAMPKGGKISLAIAQVTLTQEHVQAQPEARPGDFVCLSVTDTGTGIAPEHLSRLFEPFFTTKEIGKGTGLGLAVVYGIVKQHRGWIDVASQVGAGATFRVFLPAIAPPASDLAAPTSEPTIQGGSERILLVEDDPGVRQLSQQVLETFGYRVWAAGSGREALEVWQSLQAGAELLLTDLVMPDGMSGTDLARQLRGARPGVKVLLMSGYGLDSSSKDSRWLAENHCHFLQKPHSTRSLILAVRQCLDAP